MKKLLLAILFASACPAHADWSLAPDGQTWLYLKPDTRSHCYFLESADHRYLGSVAAIRQQSGWFPYFDGETSSTQLDDILTGQHWRYLDGEWHLIK